jgi:ADP-heptose:LPS heptosyltransferase
MTRNITRECPQSALKAQKLALFFPGALGDFICLLPAIHTLAARFDIEVFCSTEYAALVRPPVTVSALERFEINRLFVAGGGREPRVCRFLEEYHAVYSWTGSSSAVFRAEFEAAAPAGSRVFPFRPAERKIHQADYYLSCLGVSCTAAPAFAVPLAAHALAWRDDFLRARGLAGKALLVLGPGSGAPEKNWPIAHFSAIGRWWRERIGGRVVVLLGPVECERGGFDALAYEFTVARNLDLAQAAALLALSDLYVGNDSGITHLAAAVGARTVAIFGPSDPCQWAPRGGRVTVVSFPVQCAPCESAPMKACRQRRCLTDVSPAEVIGQLVKINEVATLTRGGSRITVQPL